MLLKNIRILDLSRLLPGGLCTMILSDLGAEVIKIEEPVIGDYIRVFPPYKNEVSVYHYALNRGKKSIALNLKDDSDREKFYELVKEADVVVESFRRGTVEKLKIDFETLKKINPKIVYCSIRGIVEDDTDKPIHDINAQALSGIIDLHYKVYGENVVPLIPVGDISAGLMCAISILAGITYAREKNEGIKLDVGLVESSVLFNMIPIIAFLNGGKLKDLIGGEPKAYYSVLKTKDNVYYSVAPIEEKFWESFKRLLNIELDDRDSKEAYLKVKDKFKELSSDYIENFIRNNPCCVEKVLSIKELVESKETAKLFRTIDDVKVILTPIFVNGKLNGRLGKPPKKGESDSK